MGVVAQKSSPGNRGMLNEGRDMLNEGRGTLNEGREIPNEGRELLNEGSGNPKSAPGTLFRPFWCTNLIFLRSLKAKILEFPTKSASVRLDI